jgi:hypothetical protein
MSDGICGGCGGTGDGDCGDGTVATAAVVRRQWHGGGGGGGNCCLDDECGAAAGVIRGPGRYKPLGSVCLCEVTAVRQYDECSFQVESPSRTFLLRADR